MLKTEAGLDSVIPVASDKARVVTAAGLSRVSTFEAIKDFVGSKSLQYNNITSISADYALLETDQVIMVDTTTAEVVITLPLSSGFSSGVWRNFIINHTAGTNNVKIVTSGAETFAYGNTYFNLGSHPYSFTIGTFNNGSASNWGLVRNCTVKANIHRDASWAASNFSSATAIPFDHEGYNNQSEILTTDIGGTNPDRMTILTTGTYKISYGVDIDSTGGGTWNATVQIYKNGTALENTDVRTGNYGSEDSSLSFIPTYIDLLAGEYLDLRVVQNNLTGNLVGGTLNVEIRF